MEVAITVKNLNFFYGHPHSGLTYTLKDINVNVPRGSIYGLLGPSGCGKTSLLKVIIGILKPKSGSVSVFGFQPGTSESGIPGSGLGYMPQEYALPPSLTIKETFYFFGRLYLMSDSQTQSEMLNFIQLFRLPEKSQPVKTLSVGQKQRVSLAISLFHKPRLVILDEPTVGIDPLLREVVWKYLNQLSEMEQTTFIITTHYIEELKGAARIGFMRKGQMICEDSPSALVKKFEVNNLEEIFYRLAKQTKERKCIQDEYEVDKVVIKDRIELKEEFAPLQKVTKLSSFYLIFNCLFWKSMKTSCRQPEALIILCLLAPSILWAIKFTIGRNPSNLKFAYIVDEMRHGSNLSTKLDQTSLIESIINNENNNSKRISEDNENTDLYLPDMFRQFIDHELITLKDSYIDLKAAIEDIKNARLNGAIYLGPKFSESFIESRVFTDNNWIDTETIQNGRVHLYTDGISRILNEIATNSLLKSWNEMRLEVSRTLKDEKEISDGWIDLGEPIYGRFELDSYVSYQYPILLGVTILLTFTSACAISSLGVFSELESNVFVRNQLAGVTSLQMFLSNMLANTLFLGPNTVIMFAMNVFIFEIPMHGSTIMALTMLTLQSILGVSSGMLIIIFSRNLSVTTGLIGSIMVTGVFVSGVLSPIIAMPYYFRWVAELMPFSHISDGLISIFLRAEAPFVPFILPGLLLTTILILISSLLSVIALDKIK